MGIRGGPDQALDSSLVPFHDNTVDLGVVEDPEDLWGDVANGSGLGGVRMDGYPNGVGAPRLRPSVLVDGQEAGGLQHRALDTVRLQQRNDTRSDVRVPDFVETRVEDAEGSLGEGLYEAFSDFRHGEGVGVEVGAPHELRRVLREAVVVEIGLVLRDQVGSDDGRGSRAGTEPQEEGVGIAQDGGAWKGRRRRRGLRSSLSGSFGVVLAPQQLDLEAVDL